MELRYVSVPKRKFSAPKGRAPWGTTRCQACY